MTDKEKLEKVKAEIERRKKEVEDNIFELGNFESERIGLFDNKEIYNDLLSFIDSMQEEPKECMYSKDNYTDEDRKVFCEGCEEECKFNKKEYSVNNGLDLGCGVIWKDEESISEDLEQAAKHYLYSNILYDDVYVGNPTDKDCIEMFKAGANWQKEQLLMANAVNGFVIEDIEEGNGDFLLSAEYLSKDMGLKDRQKVKVIVIKDD